MSSERILVALLVVVAILAAIPQIPFASWVSSWSSSG